jgi:hypothetical protein
MLCKRVLNAFSITFADRFPSVTRQVKASLGRRRGIPGEADRVRRRARGDQEPPPSRDATHREL